MSLTSEPAPPAPRTITIDLSRLPSAATAIGVGLLLAAELVSAVFVRRTGDLDGSVLAVGLLAFIGLLGVAAFAEIRYPGLERRASLVSWPAAAAFAGGGVLLAVLINDGKTSLYLSSAVVLALSVAGYLVRRARPFIVTGLIALELLYGLAFTDLFVDGGDNVLMIVGAGALVFVLAVTGAGWLLPKDRVFIGVLTGTLGLYTLLGISPSFLFFGITAQAEYEGSYGELDSSGEPVFHNPFENDIYAILGYCVVLVAFWALCSAATGHVGFRVLIVAMTVLAVPVSMLGLNTHHPTWWAAGLCAFGVLALAVAAARAPDAPA